MKKEDIWADLRLLGLGALGIAACAKPVMGYVGRKMLHALLTRPYNRNMTELVSSAGRATPQIIMESNLRAESPEPIQRPLGGPNKFPNFSLLMFDGPQLSKLPTPFELPVDTTTVIGKAASKPLVIDAPLIVSGMAYGVALAEKTKIAIAQAATRVGTATNTGEGPFLKTERKAAKHLIIQYNRSTWNKKAEILSQADAIEIQLGQGAWAGVAHITKAKYIDAKLRERTDLKKGVDSISSASLPLIGERDRLLHLIEKLRDVTGGAPVGVKIGASNSLEADLAIIVKSGADFVTIDGAEAATYESPPILQDDFGLPTMFALCRTVNFLEQNGLRDRIDIIVSGGLKTPGDYLKAIALGADAVAIGTMALFTVAHTQVLKPLPFYPPTQVVGYNTLFVKKFSIKKGAESLANYLTNCISEMKTGVRALGKTSTNQVDKSDLFALDPNIAKVIGLPYAGDSIDLGIKEKVAVRRSRRRVRHGF